MKPFSRYTSLLTALATVLLTATPALASPLPLSLSEAIALALQNNQKVKIAEAGQVEAAWAVKQAQSLRGPSLTFSHAELRTTVPPSWIDSKYDLSPYNSYRNQLSLGLPLYTGGKLEGLADQAKKGQAISNLSFTATRQQLKLEATAGYLKVLQARNLLAIAQQTTDSMSRHLSNIQMKFDAGIVGLPDVLQTKVRLANAQNNLIKAQNAYELSTYSLNNIMGLPLRSELEPKDVLQVQPYTQSLDACIAYALEHRPELQAAGLSVAAKQDAVQIAHSGRLPVVSVFASKIWYDTAFPGDKYDKWAVGLNVDFNVFDSGRVTSQLNQAKAGVTSAQRQAQKAQQDISLEVSSAYLNIKEAEKRLETTQVTIEQAETDLQLAKQRYEAGVGTNLDVMDAELALNQARTNHVQALYDYNNSRAQLDKAMGVSIS